MKHLPASKLYQSSKFNYGSGKMTQMERKISPEHKHLAGEHPAGDIGQIILFIIFMAVWVFDSFVFNWTDFSRHFLTFYIRVIVAVLIFVYGIYFAKRSHDIVFESDAAASGVIHEGPFARVRHPLYLSAILFYLALLFFNPTILSILIFLIIFGFYDFIARYEEKILTEKYGEDYRKYMKSVPRWIPKFRK